MMLRCYRMLLMDYSVQLLDLPGLLGSGIWARRIAGSLAAQTTNLD